MPVVVPAPNPVAGFRAPNSAVVGKWSPFVCCAPPAVVGGAGAGRPASRGLAGAGREDDGVVGRTDVGPSVTWEPLTSSAASAAAEASESVSPLSPELAVSWRFKPGRKGVVGVWRVVLLAVSGELILPSPPSPVPALKRAGEPRWRKEGNEYS